SNVVDVKIKLQNTSKEEVEKFIAYLKAHPRITELFSVAGEWDISLVLISKDAIDLGEITQEIRYKFGRLISSWSESITVRCHKFEDFNMKKLIDER
ncbi:Lrp/AsnC ligand binding domain-containing protein, partial [Nanoarchaeota archaeon]